MTQCEDGLHPFMRWISVPLVQGLSLACGVPYPQTTPPEAQVQVDLPTLAGLNAGEQGLWVHRLGDRREARLSTAPTGCSATRRDHRL